MKFNKIETNEINTTSIETVRADADVLYAGAIQTSLIKINGITLNADDLKKLLALIKEN